MHSEQNISPQEAQAMIKRIFAVAELLLKGKTRRRKLKVTSRIHVKTRK
jgi:hypothetical protein